MVQGASWVQCLPTDGRAGVGGQRRYSSLLARVGGFSALVVEMKQVLVAVGAIGGAPTGGYNNPIGGVFFLEHLVQVELDLYPVLTLHSNLT